MVKNNNNNEWWKKNVGIIWLILDFLILTFYLIEPIERTLEYASILDILRLLTSYSI